MSKANPCPCGSGRDYGECCGHYHAGTSPPTAEAMMRSRYSAYVRGNAEYLRQSWASTTCPPDLKLESDLKWIGLKIQRCEAGGVDDMEGLVEFVARYKVNGRAGRLHEASRFIRENGRWVYLDGEMKE